MKTIQTLILIAVVMVMGYIALNLYFDSVPSMNLNCDQYYNAPLSSVPADCQ
jgi:hypothetical protein